MRRCNDTITVFNAKLDRALGSDVYHPTVISGVSWYFHTLTNVGNSGLQAANQLTLRIPADADFAGKAYVSPAEFAASEDPAGVFTIKAGDIVVRGRVMEEGLRPSDLQGRGYEMATILGVTDNRDAAHAPHWRVVGK